MLAPMRLSRDKTGSQEGRRPGDSRLWLCFLALTACERGGHLQGLAPMLVIDLDTTQAIDFGDAEVGEVIERTVTLKNDGRRPLTLADADLTGHDAFKYSALPETLPAGQQAAIVLTFRPGRIGTFSAQLTFTTNDERHEVISLVMNGRGVDPFTRVCAPPLDETADNCLGDRSLSFGQVLEGQTKASALRVDAVGTRTVEVNGFSLSAVEKPACAAGTADDAIFTVTSGPLTLAPGDQGRISLHFTPPCADPSAYSATLEIHGGGQLIATARLNGTGLVDCTRHEETHTQRDPSDNRVDVLFVIDDSGSTAPYQSAIRNSATAFFNALLEGDADFHVAVTTTDYAHKRGALVASDGGVKVVTRAMENASAGAALSGFQSIMDKLDTNGSSAEYGFATIATALTYAGDFSDGEFASGQGTADLTFLRADAGFYAIIVSDADDFTAGIADVAYYIKNLSGMLGKPGIGADFKQLMRSDPDDHFGIYGIIDPGRTSSACGFADSNGTPNYHTGIDAVGASGLVVSLCSDFDATLSGLGRAISRPQCTFTVSQAQPTLDETYSVCIDGGACIAAQDLTIAAAGPGAPNGTVSIAAASCPMGGGATFRFDYGACRRSRDGDQDGVADALDNCPETANSGQEDDNADGTGDACE